MKTISNELIRSFAPCYDPSEVVQDENEELTIAEWVEKYRGSVKNKADIVWLLCREDFFSAKDLRLFAVWCAREALKLVENPDPRSVDACNVAEKFANGEAKSEELAAAWDAAGYAARAAARDAAGDAAWAAARAAAGAAGSAARAAARAAAGDAQIDKLLTFLAPKP